MVIRAGEGAKMNWLVATDNATGIMITRTRDLDYLHNKTCLGAF